MKTPPLPIPKELKEAIAEAERQRIIKEKNETFNNKIQHRCLTESEFNEVFNGI